MQQTASVVIPTFNRASTLALTVRSALHQSAPPLEVLVIDDASDDPTWEVVDGLQEEAASVGVALRYIRQAVRRGANPARNRGIELARGSAVAFLDSDDIWHPDKLKRQQEALQDTPLEDRPFFVYCGRYRVGADHQVLARQYWDRPHETARALRTVNVVGPLSAVMISIEVLRAVGGFDEALPACQDWDLFLRVIDSCRVVGVPLPLLLYLDAGPGRISKNPRRRIHAHVAMYRKHQMARQAPHGLSTFYRNLAEDLELLGHNTLAQRYLSLSRWRSGNYLGALTAALGKPRILERRYDRYRKRWQRECNASDVTMLAAFRSLGLAPG